MSESNGSDWEAYNPKEGHEALHQLNDGKKVRHHYKYGEYSGIIVEATVENGSIIYDNEKLSPSGAAKQANEDSTGKRSELNGWEWWRFYDEKEEEWKELQTLR